MHTEVYKKKNVCQSISEDIKTLNKFSTDYSLTRFFYLNQGFSLIRVPFHGMFWLLIDSNHRKTTLFSFLKSFSLSNTGCRIQCFEILLLVFHPDQYHVLWKTILNGNLLIQGAFLNISQSIAFSKQRFY